MQIFIAPRSSNNLSINKACLINVNYIFENYDIFFFTAQILNGILKKRNK